MRKLFSWRILWMGMLWLSGPLLLFVVIYPIFNRAAENKRKVSCSSNLKQIALGMFQYAQDYDTRYPLVNVNNTGVTTLNPYGWADALRPYLKSTQIFQCHNEATRAAIATSAHLKGQADPIAKGYTDYWYNARFNKLEQKYIAYPTSSLILGDDSDGSDTTNARYSLSELSPTKKPSQRHLDGGFYAFADGHVKWLKPEAITTKKPDGKNATFAVR